MPSRLMMQTGVGVGTGVRVAVGRGVCVCVATGATVFAGAGVGVTGGFGDAPAACVLVAAGAGVPGAPGTGVADASAGGRSPSVDPASLTPSGGGVADLAAAGLLLPPMLRVDVPPGLRRRRRALRMRSPRPGGSGPGRWRSFSPTVRFARRPFATARASDAASSMMPGDSGG